MKKIEIIALLGAWIFILLLHSFFLKEIYYDHDVAGYAYNTAEVMNNRGWFASTWNNKPPGINFIYLAAFNLLGRSFITTRIITILANFLAVFLLYLLGKKLLYKEVSFFFLIPIFYALFCVSIDPYGFGVNLETVMSVFEIAGILFLGLAVKKEKGSLYFISGLMMGVGFIIKQAALVTLTAGLFGIFILSTINKASYKVLIKKILIFTSAFLIPVILTSLFFVFQGVFDKFFKYTFVFSYRYMQNMVTEIQIMSAYKIIWENLGIELMVFSVLVLAGIVYALLKRSFSMILILIWFVISFLFSMVAPFEHYLLQLIAPLACLSAIGFSYIYKSILKTKLSKALIFILLAVFYLHTYILVDTVSKKITDNISDINERFMAAEFIKKRASPQDKLFVWDDLGGCSIYFWTGLNNASHFRVKYHLLPKDLMRTTQRVLAGDYNLNRSYFLAEFRKEPPIYVVVVDHKVNRVGLDLEKKSFPEFFDILNKQYLIEKKTDICTIYRRLLK